MNFERLSAGRSAWMALPRSEMPYSWSYSAPRRLSGQPVLLVLDIAPEQVIQRPERIDGDMGKRIPVGHASHILEATADSIHRLHKTSPPSCQYDQISSIRHTQSTRGVSTLVQKMLLLLT